MNIKFLKGINNIEELKKEYKKLAKMYHPDINPDGSETMKQINNEFKYLFDKLKDKKETSSASDFMNIIEELLNLSNNIIIEIVGSWVWLSGETYSIKDKIKTLGFKWSAKRKRWYLGKTEGKRGVSKKSFEEIKNTYGCQTLTNNKNNNFTFSLNPA